MNAYLAHKYDLLLNMQLAADLKNNPSHVINLLKMTDIFEFNQFHLPIEICQYIMSLVYNLVYVQAFAGQQSTTFIYNTCIYTLNDYILDRSIIDTLNKNKSRNIRKIIYRIDFWVILLSNGDAYMYGSFDNWNLDVAINSAGMFIIGNIKDISAADYYCMFITNNNELYIQGVDIPFDWYNEHQMDYKSKPVRLNFTNVKQAVSDGQRIIILFNDGKVINHDYPSVYLDLPLIKKLISGSLYTLALTYDGQIYGWGYNTHGQIANADIDQMKSQTITKIDFDKVKSVDCCSETTIILTEEGDVYSCGCDTHGELGTGSYKDETKYSVNGKLSKVNLPRIESIHCGSYHIVAITITGKIYGWGDSTFLGIPGNRQDTPIKINL